MRAFRQAGKLSMHKKIHQNIIFTIQKVRKRRAQPDSQEVYDSDHEQSCGSLTEAHNSRIARVKSDEEDRSTIYATKSREDSMAAEARENEYLQNKKPVKVSRFVPILSESNEAKPLFDSAEHNFAFTNGMSKPQPSSSSSSKIKLPYEFLISKLVESLKTPDLILSKTLPIP